MKNEITAKRIKIALQNSNMKPQELSDKSGVGKASISQYVNGSHSPSNISSDKMGEILDVNPLWLMGFDVPMNLEPEKEQPITLAAYFEGDEYTEDELDEIMQFAEFVKNRKR